MNPPNLPENFDPEDYARESLRLKDTLDEGVTVLQVTAAKRSADSGINCWHCYRRPDGGWDCFEVDCPVSWPTPEKVVVE